MSYAEFQKFVKENCPNVAKLKTQVSESNFNELMKKYSYEELIQQLMAMENYKPLAQKYTSVYLTLLKWMRMDEQKGYKQASNSFQHKPFDRFAEMKKRFLIKFPVGSTFVSKAGNEYIVESDNFLRNTSEDSVIPIINILRSF